MRFLMLSFLLISPACATTPATINVTDYANMAAAYAALPASGGTVVVPSGYAETFAADLTLSKPASGFLFTGSATITMGSYRIVNTAAINGSFFVAFNLSNDVHGTLAQGVKFNYTGSASAFSYGTPGTRTAYPLISGITIDITGGGNGAEAVRFTNTQFCKMSSVNITASGGATKGHRGIVLDGGNGGVNDFTGYCRFDDVGITSAKYGILTSNQANDNLMTGGFIISNQAAGTYGVYRNGGGGFMMLNTELGALDVAIVLDGATISDNYTFYGEATNSDVIVTAGSNDNYVNKLVTPLVNVSDGGSRNIITAFSRPRLPRSTVAGLPTCNAANEGFRFGVTDANSTTFHAAAAGGGSNHVAVYCTNSAWVIGG